MAVLKYKTSDGTYKTLPLMKVSPTAPVQTEGDSVTDVMSQKAVTDKLKEKATKAYVDTKISEGMPINESLSSLSNIPTNNQLILLNVTSNQTLSLSGSLEKGKEIHIIVNNVGSSPINVTIPSNSTYLSNTDILPIGNGKFGEINILSVGSKYYVRAAN